MYANLISADEMIFPTTTETCAIVTHTNLGYINGTPVSLSFCCSTAKDRYNNSVVLVWLKEDAESLTGRRSLPLVLCSKSSLSYICVRCSYMIFQRVIIPLPMIVCNQLSSNWLQIILPLRDLYCMNRYLLSVLLPVATGRSIGRCRPSPRIDGSSLKFIPRKVWSHYGLLPHPETNQQ